jgi:hypothetical protein
MLMARIERKDESVRESRLLLHLSCSNARTITYYKVLITDFSRLILSPASEYSNWCQRLLYLGHKDWDGELIKFLPYGQNTDGFDQK